MITRLHKGEFMNFRHISYGSFIFVLFLLILHENYSSGPALENGKSSTDFDRKVYSGLEALAQTIYKIKTEYYYKEVDLEKPIEQALSAFVRSLGPHNDFMNKISYGELIADTRGEFPGIGIQVGTEKETDDDFLRVVNTVPGGPSATAQGTITDAQGNVIMTVHGLRADDKIVEINGESLKGMSLDEAIRKIKGKKNTSVHIKVLRQGVAGLISFNIMRDIVQEQNALCYYFNDHNIYYLSLNMFTENSVQQIEQLLKKCQEQYCKALILDLRGNSGGLLNAVVDIAGLFLPKGSPVVITKDRNGQLKERYVTSREPIAQRNVPIFILVNNFTASAAEILAGCLQYYSQNDKSLLAFLVGCKTFGKGSVQEVISICNDCALRLTIALYALPNDVLIQGVGVQPDFEIEPRLAAPSEVAWFNKLFGHESNLKNSIKLENQKEEKEKINKEIKDKQAAEKNWSEKKREMIGSDYCILNAVRLIEMAEMARKAYPEKTRTRKDILTFLQKTYSPNEKLSMDEVKI